MSYQKPWLSVADQLAQLQARGMDIGDPEKAAEYLERIGYYRLSGYWYDMRKWQPVQGGRRGERLVLDQFKQGTCLRDVADLYVFDKRLRMLALDALERIEIALRVDLSHRLGQKGAFSYQDATLFHPNFAQVPKRSGRTQHEDWLSKHDELIRRSREKFIDHYRTKYGLPLAIWVACEVWDFGCMSVLFSGLASAEQDQIAQGYGLPVGSGQVFASWLRSLNYLRNVCAHHSRLWNRNVVDQPRLPRSGTVAVLDAFQGQPQLIARPFLLLCICHHLMQHINPRSSWSRRLHELLKEFPDLRHVGLTLQGMGVVPQWQAMLR
ncbi:Abi family protein [Comamonas sp. C11]|uniref:Abi family protein n=1 Tax=Comamonas sp. C11 TaxID=2966554 RepID=UPI0021135DF0|nr:Abi family protein [Comamonas sp. C11]UUC91578.1 Abi family protein [Comamonas sp. C11]